MQGRASNQLCASFMGRAHIIRVAVFRVYTRVSPTKGSISLLSLHILAIIITAVFTLWKTAFAGRLNLIVDQKFNRGGKLFFRRFCLESGKDTTCITTTTTLTSWKGDGERERSHIYWNLNPFRHATNARIGSYCFYSKLPTKKRAHAFVVEARAQQNTRLDSSRKQSSILLLHLLIASMRLSCIQIWPI